MSEAGDFREQDDSEGNLVIVDDNPNNLRLLGGILEEAGYKVRPAPNGEMALRSIQAQHPELILLDIRMPDMDGYEVCKRLKADEQTRDIPVIFISALQEVEDKTTAFKVGGVDYITKPFNIEEVLARVHTHLQLRRMQENLEQVVAERTEELRQAYSSLKEQDRVHRESLIQTIAAIALTVEKRDPYTAGHQRRVADLASAIARELGLDENFIMGLNLGAMIHDIGKLKVPAEILARPGKLPDVELSLVRLHPAVGYEIMCGVELPWPVAEMIHQHHERLDGSGYPNGLQGEQICREAKILMVADVVEAMASHRPYRAALGIDVALDDIRAGRGRFYEPDAVDACITLFEQKGYSLEQADH